MPRAAPLLEFIVEGVPRSAQSSRHSRDGWKARVAAAARLAAGDAVGIVATEVSASIVYFAFGRADLDPDNLAKPILDALKSVVFDDDGQVRDLHVRVTEVGSDFELSDPSPLVAGTLGRKLAHSGPDVRDFVYIRIYGAVDHGEL